jgi:diphosphomevalonate decarboxylase
MEFRSQAPSNIALVKYWGKKGEQLPQNPSLSMTLTAALTRMKANVDSRPAKEFVSGVLFEGEQKLQFKQRLNKRMAPVLIRHPELAQFHLNIETENTFPHSCGIASSASSMAAFAQILAQVLNEHGKKCDDQETSLIARLLSGSACRSLNSGYVSWGECDYIESSSDHWATEIEQSMIHETFRNVNNRILIINGGKKSTSSAIGHELMKAHPYAESRYKSARMHHRLLLESLYGGDWEMFGQTIEAEALELHAMMMTSYPGYFLLEPKGLEAIQLLRKWREDQQKDLYFTLDAGTNLHCLYPDEQSTEIEAFLDDLLNHLGLTGRFIQDSIARS